MNGSGITGTRRGVLLALATAASDTSFTPNALR